MAETNQGEKSCLSRQAEPRVIRSSKTSFGWTCELLWSLVFHRINLRYKETLFGFTWIFLQPVALTLIFTYIFQWFAHVPSGNVPYPLFAATGLIAWSLTSLVVSQSVQSLTSQTALLRRVALPKILLPLSAVLSTIADLLVMSLLLVFLSVFFQMSFSWTSILWVLIILAVHLALLVGISCILSISNIFLRDIAQAIPSLLQLWFFASPVFYPYAMVPKQFKTLAQWNPMTGLIEGYRIALFQGKNPPLDLLGPAFIVSFVILGVGLLFFYRLEDVAVDLL